MALPEFICEYFRHTRTILHLYFLEACVQAFKRDRFSGNIADALFIFSQLTLQSLLTILISEDKN